ncbi:hypothetical protein F5Y07DRAFT_401259 [Xylaria sp. FL0933]|nr:hypothetical protein F5Y07DRAFT_401259 [Xylaria sp. FL0933]
MAGKDSSTRLPDRRVLDAMMDDLGNNRMEELAQDDRTSHRRQASAAVATGHAGSGHPRQSGGRRNALAAMYHEAIEEGKFDDCDAAAVKDLDPLDNGNAHRINRYAPEPPRKSHAEAPGYKALLNAQTTKFDPKYDPSQAGYARKSRLRNMDPNANHSRVASLGGIGPEGSEIKRWNPGPPMNGIKNVDNRATPAAGRGRPVLSRSNPPLLPAQGPGPRHGTKAQLPSPPQTIQNGHQTPNNCAQGVPGKGHDKSIQPLPTPMKVVNVTTTTPLALHVSSPPERPRLSSLPQTTPAESASKHETSGKENSSGRSSSWVPPHLRNPSKDQAAASQSPAISRQSSPPPRQLSTEATVPSDSKHIPKIVHLEAQQIFFEDNVYTREYFSGANNELTKGRLAIYELLHSPVCVWELTIEDKGKVIRGDIRELLELLPNGSETYLRRFPGSGKVRSNPVRFSSIAEAQKFISEANFCRDQYATSSESKYTETTVNLSPAVSTTTCKSTVEPAKKTAAGAAVPVANGNYNQMKSGSSNGDLLGFSHGAVNETSGPKDRAKPSFNQSIADTRELPTSEHVDPEQQTFNFGQSLIDTRETLPEEQTSTFSQSMADLRELVPAEQEDSEKQNSSSGQSPVDTHEMPPAGQVDSEEEQTFKLASEDGRKVETVKALRNIEAIEAINVDNQSEASMAFLYGIKEYTHLMIQRSTLSSIALGTPYKTAAFGTTLVHLVEKQEFLELSRDDQMKSLALAYAIVRHGDSPIIRSQEEIFSFRSGEEACPEAVKEFNAFFSELTGRALVVSRPSQRPEEEAPRSANRHQRSSTADTMNRLADQLGSLSMNSQK